MLILILSTLLLAHEELPSSQCLFENSKITITHKKDGTYSFKEGDKKEVSLAKPTVKDLWDEKNKQVFDTYNFEIAGQKLVFKRPETKGPVKKILAEYQGKTFKCQ